MAAPEVNGYETFKYEGYTKGEGVALPTLYFKEGRYTQEHDVPENVGWHPAINPCWRGNISKESYDYYNSIRSKGDDAAKNKFKKEVMKGTYNAAPGEGFLFEVELVEGQLLAHPSRSRLITPGDPMFDKTYNAEYTKGVLAKGHLAKRR